MNTAATIINAITNIKVAGLATVSHWCILETDDGIYFVQTESVLGLGAGIHGALLVTSVIGDVIASHKNKRIINKDLSTILAESQQYFGFSQESLTQIITKKGIFGGKIIFPNGQKKSWMEPGMIKLKLSGKKFLLFQQMLQKKLTNQ